MQSNLTEIHESICLVHKAVDGMKKVSYSTSFQKSEL